MSNSVNPGAPVQFQTTPTAPLQFADKLPDAVDVVIVGGGVIGVCSAYYMAQAGLRVLLCEKGRVAAEQSSRNWGWVRQLGRDSDELPIMMESIRLWKELSQVCDEDIGFRQHGIIYLTRSQKGMASRESWMATAREHELDTRMITAAEVKRQINGAPSNLWCGGIYTPSDGRAEPWLAVPAIARVAQRKGVLIAEHCAVRDIEKHNGRVGGVITEQGTVRCNTVVLAGGAWSSLFATHLGCWLPQLTVRSTVVATTPVPTVYNGNASDEKVAFRRREDGGYTLALSDLTEHFVGPDSFRYLKPFIPAIRDDLGSHRFGLPPRDFPDGWKTPRVWGTDEISPFERNRILNPAPNRAAVQRMLERFRACFPGMPTVDVAHSWAGMIDTMPDVVPVIDHVPQHDGLVIATGFSGHGFGIGPGAGKLIANMVQGKATGYNLKRFRYSRFSDGSKIKLGPTL